MLIAGTSPAVQYTGTFLGALGIYPCKLSRNRSDPCDHREIHARRGRKNTSCLLQYCLGSSSALEHSSADFVIFQASQIPSLGLPIIPKVICTPRAYPLLRVLSLTMQSRCLQERCLHRICDRFWKPQWSCFKQHLSTIRPSFISTRPLRCICLSLVISTMWIFCDDVSIEEREREKEIWWPELSH